MIRESTKYINKFMKFLSILSRLLSSSIIHEEDISRSVCIICNEAMEDRTAHVLFQCSRIRDQFEKELQLLQQAMPPAMWMQFDALDPTGKTVFIASVMNSMYLAEWDHIYTSVITSKVCIQSYFKHHL